MTPPIEFPILLQDEGGKLWAVADIGAHWLDLAQTISGLSVEAVLADLKTAHTTRQRPSGEVATFSGATQPTDATESITIEIEDSGAALPPAPTPAIQAATTKATTTLSNTLSNPSTTTSPPATFLRPSLSPPLPMGTIWRWLSANIRRVNSRA